MRKPPIPSEDNPRQHHERPGEPPANQPVSPDEQLELEQEYEQEGREVDETLAERRHEPLNKPR